MNNKNNDFITQIEKGNFKNKNLLNVLRGMDVLNISMNYGSSFLIPVINYAATNGNIPLALTGISLLFSRNVIYSALDIVSDKLSLKYVSERQRYVTEQKLKFLERAKGIVTEKINVNDAGIKKERTLQISEIDSKLSSYTGSYHRKLEDTFNIYCNSIASIIAIGGVCVTAVVTGTNALQTIGVLGTGLTLGIGNMLYFNKKRKALQKNFMELRSKSSLARNEIINKDTITNEDKEFNIERMKNIDGEREKLDEQRRNMFNVSSLINNSLFAALIGTLTFGSINGFQNLDVSSILGMITMVYFYSDIASKVGKGIKNLKEYMEINQDYQQELEVAKDIVKQVELKRDLLKTIDKSFDKLEIKDFKGVFYTQINSEKSEYRECALSIPNLCVRKGETVLVTGESGSGKTTIFKMLKNGDINNVGSIIVDDEERIDYLGNNAIMYSPSMELSSSGNVLNEITCGKNIETLSIEEREKLLRICRGLNLDKIDENSVFRKNDILKEMQSKYFNEFSQGQKQRLVIAKILYLMRTEHQVMIFDEPTANLDKATSASVFKFIRDFCNEDMERMIIISSHETPIASKYADRIYEISGGVLREKGQLVGAEEKNNFDNKKIDRSVGVHKKDVLMFDER